MRFSKQHCVTKTSPVTGCTATPRIAPPKFGISPRNTGGWFGWTEYRDTHPGSLEYPDDVWTTNKFPFEYAMPCGKRNVLSVYVLSKTGEEAKGWTLRAIEGVPPKLARLVTNISPLASKATPNGCSRLGLVMVNTYVAGEAGPATVKRYTSFVDAWPCAETKNRSAAPPGPAARRIKLIRLTDLMKPVLEPLTTLKM